MNNKIGAVIMALENSDNIDELIEKANEGDSEAQFKLGNMYYYGQGVNQDYAKAIEWYERAAEQGNAAAQFNLGLMYDFGKGVERDYAKAIEWYEKAAEQGDVYAQYKLGVMYENCEGVEQDYAKAFEWYEKAAEQENAAAQFNLGVMYENGEGVEQDYAKAIEWYERAAGQGDVKAQFNLGVMYENGEGVEQDYAKVIEWYERAAGQGDVKAQFNLGVMYDSGQGVEQDYAKAIEWYEKAAEQGDAEAQYNLGNMYFVGNGVNRNYEAAAYWWEKSASQGDAEAQFCLSCMYRDGLGVEQNAEKAKELWEMCKDSIDFERFYVLNEKFPKIEPGEEKTSMCNDNEYEIENVKIVSGTSLAKYWRGDMQVVATDKGDFIDKMPNVGGHDWQKEIGKCIECEIRESKGHKWIGLLHDNQIYKDRTTRNSFDNNPAERHEELPFDYDLNENPKLVEAYEAIKQNTPVVFLTGGAGTGKSTFIKYLKNNLKADMNKNYVILAPTGVAAINVGGQTIHSFFRWNNDIFEDEDVTKGLYRNPVVDHTDLIIIDEISMVHSWMIDHIDYALRLWCDKTKTFGGKQLLLIGDCFQLPPVVKRDESTVKYIEYHGYSSSFFFAAKVFETIPKGEVKAFQLKKIYRQESDQAFIQILNRIRECKDGVKQDIEYLNNNCFIETRLGTKNVPQECLLLCTTKAKAEGFNNRKMLDLQQRGAASIIFYAFIEGKFESESFITPETLTLCYGAKIMITKNIGSLGLVNGDMGKVLCFGGTGKSSDDYVDIEVRGKKYHITRETWQNIEYGWNDTAKIISQQIVGTFNQIPLQLGWAVTIHKSQGLTLGSVAIDAPDAWDSGQVYVALSRAKTIDGVLLCQKIPFSAVKVDSYVQAKYKELFPNDEDDEIVDAESDYRENLSNEGFTVDKTEQITSVRIGGYEFELYPRNGEKIGRHAENTISKLISLKLIPALEMKRLQEDEEYCYETFGICHAFPTWTLKLPLLTIDRLNNENKSRYWATCYNGFYICSQWEEKYRCADKLARWLIELSKGNLNLDSISLAIKNDAPYIDVGRDKTIGSKEDDIEFVRRSFVNLPDYLRDDAWMDFYGWKSKAKSGDVSSSLNKDARKPSVSVVHEETIKNKETSIEQDSNLKNKDKNASAKTKIPLHTIKAKRKAACLNGCCQFIKEDGSLLFAEENGNLNEGLPWANEMVELSVYAKIDNKITVWSWKKIS